MLTLVLSLVGLALLVVPFKQPKLGLVVGVLIFVVGAFGLLSVPAAAASGGSAILPTCSTDAGSFGNGIEQFLWILMMVYGGLWALVGGIRWMNDRQIAIDAAEEV